MWVVNCSPTHTSHRYHSSIAVGSTTSLRTCMTLLPTHNPLPAAAVTSCSRSRSRSISRGRDRDHDSRRKHVEKKKSSGVNTFLGAGGGALIGDMIFPGLGTIGGALLGGVGGHEYGKSRDKYERSPGRRHRRYSNEDDTEYRRRKY